MSDIEKLLREESAAIRPERAAPLAGTFAARAEEEGLLDVAFALVESPLGDLVAATTKRGLVCLSYGGDVDAVAERLAANVSPRVLEAPARLDPVRRELDEYFEGRRHEFDLPIDHALTTGFTRRVLQATARIPFGETRSYADMAKAAGSPRAVRAAGNALGHNPIPIVVPCHRILRTGGALGGYTGGLHRKEHLLRLEGVIL